MKINTLKYLSIVILGSVLLISGCSIFRPFQSDYDLSGMSREKRRAFVKVEQFLNKNYSDDSPIQVPPGTRIDSIKLKTSRRTLDIYLNKYFSFRPFRPGSVHDFYNQLKNNLGRRYRDYDVTIFTLSQPLEAMVPNFFRAAERTYDTTRIPPADTVRPLQVVRNVSRPNHITRGMKSFNIALWPSHGWYYNNYRDRWEWQRPRLFQSVEDLLPMSFTIPYLLPMLQHAGANVYVPRERDTQTHEVIVDNDKTDSLSHYTEVDSTSEFMWQTGVETGFAVGNPPYEHDENPFKQGTYRMIKTDQKGQAWIRWTPDIPAEGKYAVYISYHPSENNTSNARYTVYHAGGKTEFRINQQIGGKTWIYLGTFKFHKGAHPDSGSVELSNKKNDPGSMVTADAVRFGGGMGNVARNGKVSGRPRFLEAARYYLQYAGMPDTLTYNLHEDTLDYNDDYQSRGEWVNYLKGRPYGPNRDRDAKGLGIPIDLSLAFHTDAGTAGIDTTLGTLMIYSLDDADSTRTFPDGMSRMANRDFADILQTQVVDDIKARYDTTWTRRPLENARYSEAYRPNVPAALMELLSHQNFADMKLAQDPRFRFDVSRAVYKAMLRFLSTEYRFEYQVQPLPVTHFQATFHDSSRIRLSWQPSTDSLEPSAVPDRYIVYTRKGNGGFNNGRLVHDTTAITQPLDPGVVYRFKITAVNDGGESFPSEILAAGRVNGDAHPALIVNGFDRVSGPAAIETQNFEGFANFHDEGVPDHYNINFTGRQYDFDPSESYATNDAPGFGASYANRETQIIAGNTFDFPAIHGLSMLHAGHSFVSVSDESVMDGDVNLNNYPMVDFIMGEEKTTPKPGNGSFLKQKRFRVFPSLLQEKINQYAENGGSILISGAYIGSDVYSTIESDTAKVDSTGMRFTQNTLKYRLESNRASRTGSVFAPQSGIIDENVKFRFNTQLNPDIYKVEAPDALLPADRDGQVLLRYHENRFGAAVGYKGSYNVAAFGFPFETILGQHDRDQVMQSIWQYFGLGDGR